MSARVCHALLGLFVAGMCIGLARLGFWFVMSL